MDYGQLALLFLFGLAVGVISGLFGIGGGIVLVPGLVMLFRFTQQEATGTSLAALVPPIGIFAALVYYENGFVKLPVANPPIRGVGDMRITSGGSGYTLPPIVTITAAPGDSGTES